MTRPFVWGTQVELLAASSFFQVPIYYCQASQGTYTWNMLRPVSETRNLKYPADTNTLGIKVKHFELMYHTIDKGRGKGLETEVDLYRPSIQRAAWPLMFIRVSPTHP